MSEAFDYGAPDFLLEKNGVSREEYESVPWDEPCEANGFYPHGIKGSIDWLGDRKKDRSQIIAEQLTTAERQPLFMDLPEKNPLAHVGVTRTEWKRAKRLAEEVYRRRALGLLEVYWKESKTLEGKRLELYADSVGLKKLEGHAQRARDTSRAFRALSRGLEDAMVRREQ